MSSQSREPQGGSPVKSDYRAKDYQPALDGLRAFSILAVLAYHDDRLIKGGFLGVDVFFVLSGFLITSLLHVEWQRSGRIGLGHFYLRRALRLLPALSVLLVVAGGFALMFPQASQSEKIVRAVKFSLVYATNWASVADPFSLGPLLHTWSLAVEEQFYLIWPLIFLMLLRLIGRSRRLFIVVLAMAGAAAAWRAGLYASGQSPWRLYVGTDTRADSLLIGCSASLWMSSVPNALTPGALSRLRIAGWVSILGLIGFMLTTVLESPHLYRGNFSTVALLAAILLVAVLLNRDWSVTRLLCAPPLVWIGQLSYSLYLWHLPIYGFLKVDRVGLSRPVILVVRVALVFVVASLSYYAIERPFLRLKRRWGQRSNPSVSPPMPRVSSQ